MIFYDVVPHVGVGPVKLGMARQQVPTVMRTEPERFTKGLGTGNQVDAFHNSALQVFYDEGEQKVEYIELSASDEYRVIYRGVDVFATPAEELVGHVSENAPYDPNDPEIGYTYVFPSLELALWRPVLGDEEGYHFATIGIGTVGYFSARKP